MASILDRVDPRYREILDRYMQQVPVKVGALANELGLPVVRSALPAQIAGLIEPNDQAPSRFHIKVNRYDQKERQRFTVAHEIAHFLLHRDYIDAGIVDNVMYRSKLSDSKEVEANKLAAEMIMPAAAIRQNLRNLGRSADAAYSLELAKEYEVSPSAMRVRLGLSL